MLVKLTAHELMATPTRSQREILGACQIVYFSPEDLDLVRGEPGGRRDSLIACLLLALHEWLGLSLIMSEWLNSATRY